MAQGLVLGTLSIECSPITYTIDRVEHPTYVYEPLLNSDPDNDSVVSDDGEMVITITKSMASAATDNSREPTVPTGQRVAMAIGTARALPAAVMPSPLDSPQARSAQGNDFGLALFGRQVNKRRLRLLEQRMANFDLRNLAIDAAADERRLEIVDRVFNSKLINDALLEPHEETVHFWF